jgi:hypothetical protein
MNRLNQQFYTAKGSSRTAKLQSPKQRRIANHGRRAERLPIEADWDASVNSNIL